MWDFRRAPLAKSTDADRDWRHGKGLAPNAPADFADLKEYLASLKALVADVENDDYDYDANVLHVASRTSATREWPFLLREDGSVVPAPPAKIPRMLAELR